MTTAVTPAAQATDRTRPLKILCSVICCLVLAGVVRTTLHWDGVSGVLDDVCYMRQAHLFQRFGLGGFDTDIARDDDHYLTSKLKEIDYPTWNDLTTAPCHTLMRSGKHVIQYPPGTGFTLALFPQAYQVAALYVASTAVLLGFALLAIAAARTAPLVAACRRVRSPCCASGRCCLRRCCNRRKRWTVDLRNRRQVPDRDIKRP